MPAGMPANAGAPRPAHREVGDGQEAADANHDRHRPHDAARTAVAAARSTPGCRRTWRRNTRGSAPRSCRPSASRRLRRGSARSARTNTARPAVSNSRRTSTPACGSPRALQATPAAAADPARSRCAARTPTPLESRIDSNNTDAVTASAGSFASANDSRGFRQAARCRCRSPGCRIRTTPSSRAG